MSASLVGSEMCIRDSLRNGRNLLMRWCLPKHAWAHAHVGTKRRDAPKAVSYTHLTLPTICSV
eukprot:8049327-Alexandrium_andersonii.AAC.1